MLESAGVTAAEKDLERAYRTGFEAYLEAWHDGRHYGAREQVFHVLAAFHAEADAEAVETAVADDRAVRPAGRPGAACRELPRCFPRWPPREWAWASSRTPA